MNRQTLVAAKSAAERFVQEAKLLLASKETYCDEGSRLQSGPWEYGGQPRLQGAVRRASMDLTRALADMRRPGA